MAILPNALLLIPQNPVGMSYVHLYTDGILGMEGGRKAGSVQIVHLLSGRVDVSYTSSHAVLTSCGRPCSFPHLWMRKLSHEAIPQGQTADKRQRQDRKPRQAVVRPRRWEQESSLCWTFHSPVPQAAVSWPGAWRCVLRAWDTAEDRTDQAVALGKPS